MSEFQQPLKQPDSVKESYLHKVWMVLQIIWYTIFLGGKDNA